VPWSANGVEEQGTTTQTQNTDMINFKKGPGLSLRQVNYLARPATGSAIEAGHIVRLADNAGVLEASKGASTSTADLNTLYGFAINDYRDGDVIASNVIGVCALDGQSVVETDKVSGTLSLGAYPIGTKVSVDTAGLVKVASANDRVIGQVEGVRSIPGRAVTINGVASQGPVTVLGVKLSS